MAQYGRRGTVHKYAVHTNNSKENIPAVEMYTEVVHQYSARITFHTLYKSKTKTRTNGLVNEITNID
jgi:hypothetical protein